MKKVLKVLGILLLVVIIAAGGGALYIHLNGIPTYETQDLKFKADPTPAKLERGKKLASMLCANCHMNKETRKLTGAEMKDAPQFGFIYSANITQDKEYGIGNWTDGELMYLFRTGVLKNGRFAPPWMPKFPHMADEDLEAIIAFLRSDDPMVQAAAVPDKPCEPSFLAKFLCYVAFEPLPLPEKAIPMPDTTDKVELGKYLVHNLDCYGCHSESFETMNIMEPEKTPGYLGGGNPLTTLDGKPIHSSNLTPHKETGIGNWSEEKFVRAVKYGIVEGEHALRYPMLPFSELTDYEAAAIFEYLKTVPPIENKVDRGLE